MTYPGFLICPSCKEKATNLTVIPPKGIALVPCRHTFRSDDGKAGPSKRIIICQHCHYGFTIEQATIIVT